MPNRSSLRLVLGFACSLLVCRGPRLAEAGIRIPESFNVNEDFDEKEKWNKVRPQIKCDICLFAVGDAYGKVGTSGEDEIYDYMDKICDLEDLYKTQQFEQDHAPLAPPGSGGDQQRWQLAKVEGEDARSEKELQWQVHAMKESCDMFVRPHDDEIKSAFLKMKKKKGEVQQGEDVAAELALKICRKVKVCSKKKDKKTEL